MRIELLPSTFENGVASKRQHLSTFVIDDQLAIDAGCLAMATNELQKEKIRDVVLTHAHIDHTAGLPLFVDDLFAHIKRPVQIYATNEVLESVKKNIFNWETYPDFSELENDHGPVLEYCPFEPGNAFTVEDYSIQSISVNHKVPAVGFVISTGNTSVAISGDTAEMDNFWRELEEFELDALLIECAFPERLSDLAEVSHHMTPKKLARDLAKIGDRDFPVYVINIKPMYFEEVVAELDQLGIPDLEVFEVGRTYEF